MYHGNAIGQSNLISVYKVIQHENNKIFTVQQLKLPISPVNARRQNPNLPREWHSLKLRME